MSWRNQVPFENTQDDQRILIPMIERRATRFNFGAIAEVVDLDSRREVVAVTRDLSLSGAFVKTWEPFSSGTQVRIRLTALGTTFAATGKVTGNVTPEGMGVEFVEISPTNHSILEEWLGIRKIALPGVSDDRLIRTIPVLVSGYLSTGAFFEETETRLITPERALLPLQAAVSQGQEVQLKNRLTLIEQKCRVLFVEPAFEDKRKLLEIEFLGSAVDFWRTR
jgi:hypothetical protein